VPFRLSPQVRDGMKKSLPLEHFEYACVAVLDAMGVSGFEGVFRRVCEIAMGCIRGNRDMLDLGPRIFHTRSAR